MAWGATANRDGRGPTARYSTRSAECIAKTARDTLRDGAPLYNRVRRATTTGHPDNAPVT